MAETHHWHVQCNSPTGCGKSALVQTTALPGACPHCGKRALCVNTPAPADRDQFWTALEAFLMTTRLRVCDGQNGILYVELASGDVVDFTIPEYASNPAEAKDLLDQYSNPFDAVKSAPDPGPRTIRKR